jgi:hypothetical protein
LPSWLSEAVERESGKPAAAEKPSITVPKQKELPEKVGSDWQDQGYEELRMKNGKYLPDKYLDNPVVPSEESLAQLKRDLDDLRDDNAKDIVSAGKKFSDLMESSQSPAVSRMRELYSRQNSLNQKLEDKSISVAERGRAKKELKSVGEEHAVLFRIAAEHLEAMYLNIMDGVRPTGPDHDAGISQKFHSDSKESVKEAVAAQLEFFPRAWANESCRTGRIKAVSSVMLYPGSGLYVHSKGIDSTLALIPDESGLEVDTGGGLARHELMHRMQEIVPGIKDLENEFLELRKSKSADKSTITHGVTGDIIYPDDFYAEYMGRTYKGDSSLEVLPEGVGTLYDPGFWEHESEISKSGIPNHVHFILGTLAKA